MAPNRPKRLYINFLMLVFGQKNYAGKLLVSAVIGSG